MKLTNNDITHFNATLRDLLRSLHRDQLEVDHMAFAVEHKKHTIIATETI